MYDPRPENHFSFGLGIIGDVGCVSFGKPLRKSLTPLEIVHMLAETGAWGVNFHAAFSNSSCAGNEITPA